MRNIHRNCEHQTDRSGITIIEVLTAMVVAMIGVFGVMILIPFAVKQAEVGLDLDEAYRLAQNGVAQFEISGYQRLVTDPTTGNQLPLWIDNTGAQISTPDVYAFDPLSIFGNGGVFDQFPPSFSITAPPINIPLAVFPVIKELNLANYNFETGAVTPWTNSTGVAMARRMFRNDDDLVFGDAISDLDPPQQFYDTDATGLGIGRQSRGEMSWMAIVVPSFDAANPVWPDPEPRIWKYRMYVLVFKNRILQTSITNPVARFPIAKVDPMSRPTPNPTPNPPGPDIGYGGGNVTLQGAAISDVRKDDWVMLINENPDPKNEIPDGFEKQVGFFRVIATFDDTMTLDGPDFVFDREDPDDANRRIHIDTYAVHLANYDAVALADDRLQRLGHVVSVYERTFVWEQDSAWNK